MLYVMSNSVAIAALHQWHLNLNNNTLYIIIVIIIIIIVIVTLASYSCFRTRDFSHECEAKVL